MTRLLQFMATNAERRPGRSILVILAITVVLGTFATRQSTDTEVTAFAPSGGRAEAYEVVRDNYVASGGRVQLMVDAGPGGNVFDPAILDATDALAQAVASDPDLDGLLASAAAPSGAAGPNGPTPVVSFVPAARDLAATATSASASAGDAPAADAQLFSVDLDPATPEARGGLVVVSLNPDLDDNAAAQASLAVARAASGTDDDLKDAGAGLVAFNPAIINDAILADSETELPRLLGVSLALITLMLALLYRSFSDVATALVGLMATIAWMTGFAVLLGPEVLGWLGPFTQVTTIIPVLLVGLGVDYSIHLTLRYREERRHDFSPHQAGAMAVRTVGGALALATLTTMVGFLTNVVSPLPPIRDFGIFTAAGIASAFVVMGTLVPSMRVLLDRRRTRNGIPERSSTGNNKRSPGSDCGDTASGRGTTPRLATAMGRVAVLAERAPRVTLAVGFAVTVLAVLGAVRLETTFDQQDFIPGNSVAANTLDLVDELFGGDLGEVTYLVFTGSTGSSSAPPATNRELPVTGEALAGVPGVRVVDGAPEVAELPRAPGADQSGGDMADGRVPVAVYEVATNAGVDGAERLANDLEAVVARPGDTADTVLVTSEPLVVLETLGALTTSQVRSIIITLVAATLLLAVYFRVVERRWSLGPITMVPSLAVVVWILGTMWAMGLTLNVLTAMIASLAIGIGVPFGIHVTNRFLEDRRRYPNLLVAIRQTVTHTGGAMAGSALTTAVGFGVLVLSALEPIRQFGLIVAITIVYSFLATVVIQPSFLRLWGDHQGKRNRRHPGLASQSEDATPAGASSGAERPEDTLAPTTTGSRATGRPVILPSVTP